MSLSSVVVACTGAVVVFCSQSEHSCDCQGPAVYEGGRG